MPPPGARGWRLTALGVVAAAAAVATAGGVPPRNVCLAARGGAAAAAAGPSCGGSAGAAAAASAPSGGGGIGGGGGRDAGTLPTAARPFGATDFPGVYTKRLPSVDACPSSIVHTSNGSPPPSAIPATFTLPASLAAAPALPPPAVALPSVATVYLRHASTAMDGAVCGPSDGGLLLASSSTVPAEQRELILVAAASALEGRGRPLPAAVTALKDQLSDFWVGVETGGRVCGGAGGRRAVGVFPAGTTVAFLREDETVTTGLLRFSSRYKYMVVVHNPTALTCVYRAELSDPIHAFAADPPPTPTPLPTPSPSPTAAPEAEEEETADVTGVEEVGGDGEDDEGGGGLAGRGKDLLSEIANSSEGSKDKLTQSGVLVAGALLTTLLTAGEPSPTPSHLPLVTAMAPPSAAGAPGGGQGNIGVATSAPSAMPNPSLTAAGGDSEAPAAAGGDAQTPATQETGLLSGATAAESPACFPGDALVATASGGTVRMADVGLSTELAAGPGARPSTVYFFSHRQADTPATPYTRLTLATSTLEVTPGHLLPLHGSRRLVAAGAVAVGDALVAANGSAVPVLGVARVVRSGAGLYNPHTAAGEMVVAGVLVSCYTTAVDARVAAAELSLVRAAAAAGVGAGWRARGWAAGGGWLLYRLGAALTSVV